jgi:cell wall-associated NlpC family hydrolase
MVTRVRTRALLTAGLCGALLAGGAGVALVRADADDGTPAVRASIAGWRWAPREPGTAAPAGRAAAPGTPARDRTAPADATRPHAGADPAPSGPASRTRRPRDGSPAPPEPRGDTGAGAPASPPAASRTDRPAAPAALGDPDDADAALVTAEVLDNGVALPPLEAPPAVRAIFEAGNTIARAPYKWGGGHGRWKDDGYDCSGSVSYALAAAGLLDGPRTSGELMRYGKPGKGRWVTIYANEGHVWMVVAGVRFDTVARGRTGSRWIATMADTSGYVARHPEGL